MRWEALLDSPGAAFVQQQAHGASNRTIYNSCCPEAKVYDILDQYQPDESTRSNITHLETQVKAVDRIDSLSVFAR